MLIALSVLLARGWRPSAGAGISGVTRDPSPPIEGMPRSDAIEQRFGVRFTAVVLTASGGVVQIRYQVLDKSKARALHEQGTFPYLRVGAATLDSPVMAGHGSGADMVPGRSGSILLANTAHALKVGDRVSLRIGDLTLEQVPVG